MNKKGFTLIELLVVVVILGIIAGLSIPLIRNLTTTFDKRKYQSYADSVLYAAKLYNDAYKEDLFGHNKNGCAYVTYDNLVEKQLINDIEIEGMSCNSAMTYVVVTKQGDKYGYSPYIGCGKKVDGSVEAITVKLPKSIPEMDTVACAGAEQNNLRIEADMSQAGAEVKRRKKKTKLTITSGTGINKVTSIYTKWSKAWNDYSNNDFKKIDFKISGNQESQILQGKIISSQSKEILTPSAEGEYYLIVRVDFLEDLYGTKWENPKYQNSKYIEFGPFVVYDEEGHQSDKIKLTLTNPSEEEWTNTDINLGISAESENEIDTYESTTNILDDDSWKEIPEGVGQTSFVKTYSETQESQLFVRAYDVEGNYDEKSTWLRIDKVRPDKPSISNPTNGNWTNKDVTVSVTSRDEHSGINTLYYTYNEHANKIGTDPNNDWVALENETNTKDDHKKENKPVSIKLPTFTANSGEIFNKTIYVKASDKAGNFSDVNQTNVRIDKQKPTTPVITNTACSKTEWATKSFSIVLKSNDGEGSGIASYFYSYKSKPSKVGTDSSKYWVKDKDTSATTYTSSPFTTNRDQWVYWRSCDKAGNCSETAWTYIKLDTVAPTCKASKQSGTSGATATFKCSDNKSGVVSCTGKKTGLKTGDYSYEIKDKAGNKGKCAVSVKRSCASYKCTSGPYVYTFNTQIAHASYTKSQCIAACKSSYPKCTYSFCYKWVENKLEKEVKQLKAGIWIRYYTVACATSGTSSTGWGTFQTTKGSPAYVNQKTGKDGLQGRGCCGCCREWKCKSYTYK